MPELAKKASFHLQSLNKHILLSFPVRPERKTFTTWSICLDVSTVPGSPWGWDNVPSPSLRLSILVLLLVKELLNLSFPMSMLLNPALCCRPGSSCGPSWHQGFISGTSSFMRYHTDAPLPHRVWLDQGVQWIEVAGQNSRTYSYIHSAI